MKDLSTIKDEATLGIVEDVKHEIFSSVGNAIKELVLYGSYARNDQTLDSDIDIVAFVDCEKKKWGDIRNKLSEIKVDLSLKYDVVISIIIKDYRQYLASRETVPFYSNIYRDGVAIYG